VTARTHSVLLGLLLGAGVLASAGISRADVDPCTRARQEVDETARDFLQQNREYWTRGIELLYAEYRGKIEAELAALNRDTQARLKTARSESERGAIRSSHHERRTAIVKQWQEYHEEKQELDRRFQAVHFEIQDQWYAEIWQLRTTEDCGYGASRLTEALRQLLIWTGEQIEKNRRPPREPLGSGGGIRG